MLRIENLGKSWGTFKLRAINLDVPQGEFFVLLGPSGAGKSLLLELVAGFHRPDCGRIYISGTDVTALPPERRNVGFVHQDHMLFPHKSVRLNIAYGLESRRVEKAAARDRVDALASELHLEPLMDRSIGGLSGGEKQRVSLARALVVQPALLLLDEPFSSLDPPVRQRLWDALKGIQRHTATTTLLVTHDRAEALALGGRIGIIAAGHIEQTGADLSVFEMPNSHFVAHFTGGTNIYAGRSFGNGALTTFTSGALTLISTYNLNGTCKALVRPENIIVSRAPTRTSARNQLRGRVQSVTRRGQLFEVVGRFDEHLMTCIVTPQSVEELRIAPGAEVYFSFKAGSVHLFEGESETRHCG